ncbi:hypothetical protein [Chelativorans sp. YIM 93263]|uniref:hypothetical protein n=1 Tax=Chelativorans sp. YIM 93263 TaxID=2906648 RepID=UPI002379505A|nr:hypothetical protein [Chelativorans sp. YIM 93263]
MSLQRENTGEWAPQPLRSVGAVLLGLLVVFVLSLGTDQVLHSLEVYPPWSEPMSTGQYFLALIYRIVYAVLGSYIAARFAPVRPMLHAMVLGFIGLALSIAGAAAMCIWPTTGTRLP